MVPATEARQDPLELVAEWVGGVPPENEPAAYRAGFRVAWQACRELLLSLSRRRGVPAPSGDPDPGPEVIDLSDPDAVVRLTTRHLRSVASLLERSSSVVADTDRGHRHQDVVQAMSDTATTVKMSAEAIEHLVSRPTCLPRQRDTEQDPENAVAIAADRMHGWIAAYALLAAVAEHDPEPVIQEITELSGHDPAILEEAREALGGLDAVDERIRDRANRLLAGAAEFSLQHDER